jgi:hypothetical protein
MDRMAQFATSLGCEDAIIRAVHWFSSASWRPSGQSGRTATFQGRPPIPWFMLLLTILGFLFCLIPGIIMYFMVIAKARRFQNLVVTAHPIAGGSQVVVQCPPGAQFLTRGFSIHYLH